MHPWPEPPRSRSTAPMAISSESTPPEESVPRLENVRDPSNRAPKVAAIISLLIAAGLSGFGLAIRGAPSSPASASAGEPLGTDRGASPADPHSAPRAPVTGEGKVDEHRANRNPTRVTDLPAAVEGVPGHGTAPTKPSEVREKQDPSHEAANTAAAQVTAAPNAAAAPNAGEGATPGAGPAEAPTSISTGAAEPGAAQPSSTVANVALPSAPAAAAAPAPQPAANTPAPAPAGRAKGDFNTQAARETLEDAAGRAGKCRNIDTPAGTARVAVTFAPNGHVTHAAIESGPFVGTAAGNCVASKFRAAKVPPFSGESVIVRKSIPF